MQRSTPIAFALLAVCGTTGCTTVDPVSKSIGAVVRQGPGTRLSLGDHTPFEWDRLCIFGPFTPLTEIDKASGIAGAAQQAHDIDTYDDINLLLFIDGKRIVKSLPHPRDLGDFGPEYTGKCFPRAGAVFSVRERPLGSSGDIGPP